MSWSAWSQRWERFQEGYVPLREQQFDVIAACVQAGDGRRVLDLCAGPGSAGRRLLRRMPDAEVVAVDCDPWLLELGRQTAPKTITWLQADLRDADWTAALPHHRFDAVVTTTALQWFTSAELERIYCDVHACMRQAGRLLISDVFAPSPPVRSQGEHWSTFWAAARAEPSFAGLLAERDRQLNGRFPLEPRDQAFHDGALRGAGFTSVDEVWRHDANAILLAVAGG